MARIAVSTKQGYPVDTYEYNFTEQESRFWRIALDHGRQIDGVHQVFGKMARRRIFSDDNTVYYIPYDKGNRPLFETLQAMGESVDFNVYTLLINIGMKRELRWGHAQAAPVVSCLCEGWAMGLDHTNHNVQLHFTPPGDLVIRIRNFRLEPRAFEALTQLPQKLAALNKELDVRVESS